MKTLSKNLLRLAAFMFVCNMTAYAFAEDVQTGPIFSNNDAQVVCPVICGGLVWNHQWTTTVPGTMSVCFTTSGNMFEVGPIFSNDEAQTKCPEQLARVTWSGQWKTTVPNTTSVCGCNNPPPLAQ